MNGTARNEGARSAIAAGGLGLLLPLATLGEGGGSIGGLLTWHAWLVGVWIVWWLAPAAGGSDRSIPRAPLIGFGAFVLMVLLGAVRAPYAYAAFLVGLELAGWIAVVALAVASGPNLLTRLVWILRIAAGVQGLYVIAQQFVLGQTRPAATFLNPNHLGLWMVAVILLGFGVALWPEGRGARGLVVVTGLLALTALLLSGSRGAMIGLIVGGLWLASRHWARLARPVRYACLVSLIGVSVVGLLTVRQRLEAGDPFFFQRLDIWQASTGALQQDPVWGTGPGQFRVAAANLRFPDGDGPLRYDKAFSITHSDWLRVPVEFGTPAAIALLASLGLGLWSVRRRRQEGSSTPGVDGGIAALIAIGTHGLVDNPSTWPAVYLLGGALLGAVLATPTAPCRRLALGWRAAVAGLVLTLFVVGDVGPTIAASKAAKLPRGSLSAVQEEQLGMALSLNPLHPDLWRRRAEALSGRPKHWGLQRYSEAREAAERSVRLQPADARYHRGLARVEALAARTLFRDVGSVERALEHYRRAEARAGFDPFLLVEQAAFLLDVGEPARARAAAERAMGLEPEAVIPRLLLADAVLATEGPHGAELAERLLDEARLSAERWKAWESQGRYAQGMLRLDIQALERIERKIAGMSVEDGSVREALVDIY